jgi:hypothetical protein
MKKKPLMKIHSVFPFDLFPNTIALQKNKIDIIHRHFFFTKEVFTVFINDIRTIRIHSGPFFATLSFELKGMTEEQNPEPISFLRKKNAHKIRGLALKLCVSQSKNKS